MIQKQAGDRTFEVALVLVIPHGLDQVGANLDGITAEFPNEISRINFTPNGI